MNWLIVVALAVAPASAAWWLTGVMRRYAMARQVLDIPNARSSHTQPTPRGGGMAIVLTSLGGFLVLAAAGLLRWSDAAGLCGGGTIVAAVGFADDHLQVKRRWRLLAHFAAAAVVIVPLVWAGPVRMPTGIALAAATVIGVLYVVWLINLTNFMDGIDGIAALETITVCVGGAVLHLVAGSPIHAWPAAIVLAAAAFGFLLWNWPPAKIFMGDVGSGFLGVALAALALQAGSHTPVLFWGWLILMAVFVADATLTLTRRLLLGARIYDAHRTHAYQHATAWCQGHKAVTMAVGAINTVWLLPLAVLVARNVIAPAVGLLLAYAPLFVVAWRLGAGTPATSRQRAIV